VTADSATRVVNFAAAASRGRRRLSGLGPKRRQR
jgi:hypothetical protein